MLAWIQISQHQREPAELIKVRRTKSHQGDSMTRISRQLFAAALTLAAAVTAATPAAAQDYPNKPVRIVVAYAAGAAPDLVARILGEKLQLALGQPFVVDNRPGAAGTVAGTGVSRAPADGYTLMIGDTSTLLIAPYVVKNLPYEPLKVFRPIAMTASLPYLLVSSDKGSTIRNFQDMLREAKAKPGLITYGSPGFGSNHHIAMEALAAQAGIQLQHVPYGPQLNPAVIAGTINLAVTSLSTLGSNATSGVVHLLAVTTPVRFPAIPNVPTVGEFLPGYDFTSEQGFVAPAGTPDAIVDKLSAAIRVALQHPDVLARFKTLNIMSTYLDAKAYGEKLRAGSIKFGNAIKIAKVEPS